MTGRRVVLIAGGGSGGHLMPALAIATALREMHPSYEPVLVGASRGVEARVLPTRDFRYHLLPSEPIYRRTWWRNARWPMIAWRLRREVKQLFREEVPVGVLGTGGYASAPVVWWAARRGLPTAVQEQNAYPGLATRLLARRVRQIYLGVPEAERLLRPGGQSQVFDTGNPIMPPNRGRRAGALMRLGLEPDHPVLLVTGGSQGALAINRAVGQWLESEGGRLDGWQLLWLTGRRTHQQFVRWHAPPAVTVIDFLDPMADAYAVADLVVSRAGMITVAELCAWGLPSILVPLPTAAADHQRFNAVAMAEAGAARMLLQSEVGEEGLRPVVVPLMADSRARAQLAARALSRGRPDASQRIVSLFTTLIQHR